MKISSMLFGESFQTCRASLRYREGEEYEQTEDEKNVEKEEEEDGGGGGGYEWKKKK